MKKFKHGHWLILLALWGFFCHAESLFGDYSCRQWRLLPYAEKKTWSNAFFAPLSLTYKGLQKSQTDKYNDDPRAYEAAIGKLMHFAWFTQSW
jgi:hypothetical protein